MIILDQIFVYPVKSLAGFAVDSWPVVKTGLQYDRQWMLVDANGEFLSQRRLSKMALIKTRIANEQLYLHADNEADLVLPLSSSSTEKLAVTIWDDQCTATAVGDTADAWFSRVLDYPCRLVVLPVEELRHVDPAYARSDDITAFSDGFPFLLVSSHSLDDLNAAMGLNLDMQRFRPNLVVKHCAAYAEDHWRRIKINDIEFRLPKPCSRCSVPTIDPSTGISGKEPLTTLSRLRQAQKKVYFGQNAIHNATGRLSTGDVVEILEIGPAQPFLA